MEFQQNAESPEAFRKILESCPADEYAASNLMVFLIKTKRVAEAREMCRRFHAAGGVSANIAVNAVYLFADIFYDEYGIHIGSAILERARQRYPEDAGLWFSSYMLSSLDHNYRRAMSHAAKAAALDPVTTFQCLRIHTPLTV
jgi:predicted Zn-dependent protease